MCLEEIQTACHYLAREKGFWDKKRNVPEMLALIHAEVSEALEEYRKDRMELWWSLPNGDAGEFKPEGFGVELADAVIRILDLAEGLNIDLAKLIRIKLEYNKTRELMHGKRC
jgi:NTP pyrophosphatase (non-canonical NTP hydrolase)